MTMRGGSIGTDVLRDRVRIYLKVLFWINLALALAGVLARVLSLDPAAPEGLQAPDLLGGALTALLGLAWAWTARGTPPRVVLVSIESLGTLAIAGFYTYAVTRSVADARFFVLPLISLALVLRASIVPSSVARTGVVGVAAVSLAVATVQTMSSTEGIAELVWTATLGLAVVAVTAVTSSVIYGLRKAVRSAQRLGQYEIRRALGEGAMGIVFEATHVLLKRPTAIKVLKAELAGEQAIERFEREVRETSRLEHPNSVYIYDYGRTSDGQFYYAMEFLDGWDLQEIITEHGPMPDGRVVGILLQAAQALAEAHEKGLVHRDVKPANIMLCDRGGTPDMVKVLDFGLVKSIATAESGLTQAGTIMGTPHYLAPESMHDVSRVGPQADVYALGGTAYFLLTGATVFEAASAVEVCARHLRDPPEPPENRVGRAIDEGLTRLIMRCLEKDPADRFSDGRELAEALVSMGAVGWTTQLAREWWDLHPPRRSDDPVTDEHDRFDVDLAART